MESVKISFAGVGGDVSGGIAACIESCSFGDLNPNVTFCFIPYYIFVPSSVPCHETMNTDDTPLIVVTPHNMTSQYKSTPRRTVNCFVTSFWQRQRSSINSYTPIGLSHKIMI
jgi:hypothetical protein